MALTLSSTEITEKNKLGTESIWYLFIDILYPTESGTTSFKIVRNHEAVVWKGETWNPAHFEFDEIGDHTQGEAPQVILKFSNVDRVFQTLLGTYDTYCKQNGLTPLTCHFYFVNSANIASSTPAVEYEFILKSPRTSDEWASFTFGASNFYARRFPRNRVLRNMCRFKYKDERCAATSVLTTCNHTLTDCIERGNYTRFGGFPTAALRGLKIR